MKVHFPLHNICEFGNILAHLLYVLTGFISSLTFKYFGLVHHCQKVNGIVNGIEKERERDREGE